MGKFYVTTPIYYVNDLPHIGHIFTTVAADTVARYRRLAGDEVYFLTGTDEHGQNIERAAEKQGVTPITLADRVVSRYHELWEQLGISHDDFIRTTEERHRRTVEAVVARIVAAGDIYSAPHEGWYCTACESFYTEKELAAEQLCPVHDSPAEWKSEENLFFRLSKYQQPLLDWYAQAPCPVQPRTRANEVRRFVESGLRDLSVSRANLSWGIPFPGHPGQTIYVWLDALVNYLSALGYGTADGGPEDGGPEVGGAEGGAAGEAKGELYQRFWEPAASTRLHLVGKDILRFHAVYWPAFLMSAGLPLPNTVWAHGWWLRDERKISKSVGNIPRLDDLLESFGADSVRYFLLRDMVFGQDAQFSDEAFVQRFNSDLANDLGNTLSRVVTLTRTAFNGRTPPKACDDNPLIPVAESVVEEYRQAMDAIAFERALKALWRLLAETNQYLVEREPWKLVKLEEPGPSLSRILWNGLEAVRIVATGLLPFMPQTAPRLLAATGNAEVVEGLEAMAWGRTPTDVELPQVAVSFPRIDKEAYLAAAVAPPTQAGGGEAAPATTPEKESKPMISIEDFFRTELKIATVTAAEPIPKSSKLLKITVDLGAESRTVVAGIAKAYTPQDLIGKQVVVVANLQPAKLMGVESQGMVLAASEDGRPILLHPAQAVPNGTPVK